MSKKEQFLRDKAKVLTDKGAEIKTNIKVILQSIADLMQITPAAPKPRRDDIL